MREVPKNAHGVHSLREIELFEAQSSLTFIPKQNSVRRVLSTHVSHLTAQTFTNGCIRTSRVSLQLVGFQPIAKSQFLPVASQEIFA